MIKVNTLHFGELELDNESDFEFVTATTTANGKEEEVNIALSDFSLYAERTADYLAFLDGYDKLNAIAKKAIIEAFPVNESVSYYFECHFDVLEEEDLLAIFGVNTLEKFDIAHFVEHFTAPDLLFGFTNGELFVSVDYMVSKEHSDEILCVKIDKDFNVYDFSHES